MCDTIAHPAANVSRLGAAERERTFDRSGRRPDHGRMNPSDIDATAAWLAQCGLAGHSGLEILTGFCKRAVACGLPLARAIVIIDTLDPVHEGQAFRWRSEGDAPDVVDYGSSAEGEAAENWRRSPF